MKKGFTLIELLVVVLIIGILAAIAVPQYQKAVMKSRLSELDMIFSTGRKAIDAYLLRNGLPEKTTMFTGTNRVDALDVSLPGTPCTRACNCVDRIGAYDIGCSTIHCGITLRTSREAAYEGEEDINVPWLGGEGGNIGVEYMPETGWALVNVPDDLKARKIVCEWWQGKIIDSPRTVSSEVIAQTKCAEVGVIR